MISSDEHKRLVFLNNWLLGKAMEYRGMKNVPIGHLVLNAPESVREKLKMLKSGDLNFFRKDIILGAVEVFRYDHNGRIIWTNTKSGS